jgi:cytochrome c oxidase assembly protein Cox11
VRGCIPFPSQDPEFALDPKMKGVDTLTLSYTFFKVEEEAAEPAAKAA